MITDCFNSSVFVPGTIESLFEDILEFALLVIPLSLCLAVWLRYNNKSEHLIGLGLGESSTVSETPTSSWPWHVVYIATLTLAFLLGMLTFEAYQLLLSVLNSLWN